MSSGDDVADVMNAIADFIRRPQGGPVTEPTAAPKADGTAGALALSTALHDFLVGAFKRGRGTSSVRLHPLHMELEARGLPKFVPRVLIDPRPDEGHMLIEVRTGPATCETLWPLPTEGGGYPR